MSRLLGRGGQTNKHTDTQTDTHINTMTRPGLGAGLSEKSNNYSKSYTAGAIKRDSPPYYIRMQIQECVHLVQFEVSVLTKATRIQEVFHIQAEPIGRSGQSLIGFKIIIQISQYSIKNCNSITSFFGIILYIHCSFFH